MLEWLGPVGGIVLVDLVLSGDNALVIGAAAAGLPRKQRLLAILFGGGGAIVLRILFAILATLLLQLPYLEAFGAVILVVIAVRLLIDRYKEWQKPRNGQTEAADPVVRSFLASLLTIVVADVTMSLDNVLAVGALASGNVVVLVGGLLISISLLLIGSALVAELISRLPWLLDVACLVLAWTAGHMALEDKRLGRLLEQFSWSAVAVYACSLASVLAADVYLWVRSRRKQAQELPGDKVEVK